MPSTYHLRLQHLRVHLRLGRREPFVRRILQPELEGQRVKIVVQTPARGKADHAVHQLIHPILALHADGLAIERHAHVLAHGLHFLVFLALEPRQNGVAREEIHPAFQRLRNLDAQLKRALHDGRARIGREDIGPELRARILAADVHHQPDGFAALRSALAREIRR